MAWECSDCGQKEQRGSKITVCHHCGRPVCKMHREMIDDPAFSAWSDQTAASVAIHCLDCLHIFHSQAIDVGSGATGSKGLTSA